MTVKKEELRCPQCGASVARYHNPFPTVDIIIETEGRIVLIERANEPRQWALPGGFCDYGESLEDAAVREAKEETGLDIDLLEQFYTYSNPARDPRQHNISTVFIARARSGVPRAGDDARDIDIFSEANAPADLAFDHSRILADYFNYRRTGRRPRV